MPVSRTIGTENRMMLKPITLERDLQDAMTFWAPLTSVLDAQGAGSTTPTFTRATVATHISATTGLVVRDASGAARFEANGYLSEGARTNLALWSDDFTNAAWVISNSTDMTVAKTSTGPDGVANSATRVTSAATNSTILQAITSSSAARVTSCWIKRITGSGTVNMTQDNGTTWAPLTLTTSWARYSIAAATLANPTVGLQIVTSGDAIDVSLFQHEVGAFISSAIPTTSAAVTRNEEILTFPSGANYTKQNPQTILLSNDYNSPANNATNSAFVNASSAANTAYLYSNGSATNFGRVFNGTGNPVITDNTTLTAGLLFARCYALALNDAEYYTSGVKRGTAAPTSMPTSDSNPIGIGDYTSVGNTGSQWGHIRGVYLFGVRLTGNEMGRLTARPL